MSNYTDEEVNEGIAEFMFPDKEERGRVFDICGDWDYTESLDSQVPVMEKLDIVCDFDICRSLQDEYRYTFHAKNFTGTKIFRGKGKTLQRASAHALYKAILEIKK